MKTRKIEELEKEKKWLNWRKTVQLVGRQQAGAILDAAMESAENILALMQYIGEVFTPELVVDIENARRVKRFFPLREIKRIYQEEEYWFFIEYLHDLLDEYQ